MKEDTKTTALEYYDIDARYLISVFDTIRLYPKFYNFLCAAPVNSLAINLIYDYQLKKKGHSKPLRSISLREFTDNAHTFHTGDRFALSLSGGECIADNQVDADILFTLLIKNANYRTALCTDKWCDVMAKKYEFSQQDKKVITGIFDTTCADY